MHIVGVKVKKSGKIVIFVSKKFLVFLPIATYIHIYLHGTNHIAIDTLQQEYITLVWKVRKTWGLDQNVLHNSNFSVTNVFN